MVEGSREPTGYVIDDDKQRFGRPKAPTCQMSSRGYPPRSLTALQITFRRMVRRRVGQVEQKTFM